MGIPYDQMGIETVFTHIDDDGVQTMVAVDRLVQAVADHEVCEVPVDSDFAAYCRSERGIEQHRLDRLTAKQLKDPILVLVWPDGTHLLADGHHRYVKHAALGHEWCRAQIVDETIWRQFVVDAAPQATRLDLKTMFSGII